MSVDKMREAQEFIKNRQYEQAYQILITIHDNPTADRWIEKLQEMGYGSHEKRKLIDGEFDMNDGIDTLFDGRSISRRNLNSQTVAHHATDPEYNIVILLSNIYKILGFIVIGIAILLALYAIISGEISTGLGLGQVLSLVISGTGLLFASQVIMMFHELVINSRKQRDFLQDIASKR